MARDNEQRRSPRGMADVASMFISVFGIFLIAVLLIFLVRIQRGLLGIVLAGVAVVLIIYWMREIRNIFRGEFQTFQSSKKKWTYDVLEGTDLITVVAEVPGPSDQVKIKLNKRSITIFGGDKFQKKISIPKGISLIDKSYVNGVLNVRLSKSGGAGEDSAQGDSLSSADKSD
jgi:HSP20 family molecular chaperone IbpA